MAQPSSVNAADNDDDDDEFQDVLDEEEIYNLPGVQSVPEVPPPIPPPVPQQQPSKSSVASAKRQQSLSQIYPPRRPRTYATTTSTKTAANVPTTADVPPPPPSPMKQTTQTTNQLTSNNNRSILSSTYTQAGIGVSIALFSLVGIVALLLPKRAGILSKGNTKPVIMILFAVTLAASVVSVVMASSKISRVKQAHKDRFKQ